MLAKRIIPCMDIKDGRIVKGIEFKNLKDAGDPVETAKRYSEEGADELVFLDITASSDRRKTQIELVRRTSEEIFIPYTVGGGITTVEDIKDLLRAGADKISVNTAAVQNPDLISRGANEFGSQCIVCAIDAKKNSGASSWQVFIYGGREPVDIDVLKWAQRAEKLGAGEILLTSMDADGSKDGYDIELTRAVSEATNIPVIASGGAGSLQHLAQALQVGKADAVLAASIFHYGTHSIKEAKEYLKKKGIQVRL